MFIRERQSIVLDGIYLRELAGQSAIFFVHCASHHGWWLSPNQWNSTLTQTISATPTIGLAAAAAGDGELRGSTGEFDPHWQSTAENGNEPDGCIGVWSLQAE